MKKDKVSFVAKDGTQQQVSIGLEHYAMAQKQNLSLRQLVNTMYPTTPDAKSDTFTQMLASVNFNVKPVKEFGIRPLTMAEIEYGGLEFSAGTQGMEVSPVQTKYLFPAVVAELVENKLFMDRASAISSFDSMIAITNSVAGRRVEQPVLDFSRPGGPESARNQARAQGAEPDTMLTIKASQKAVTIPETPLAVQITDEVAQSVTVDFVALAMARQAEVEMYNRVGEDLLRVLNGDADAGSYGTAALAQTKANTLDTSIVVAGTLTEIAYVKWLYSGIEKRRISYIVTDLAGAMAIHNRSGKPTQDKDESSTDAMNAKASIFFPDLVKDVQIFIVPAAASWPANTIMGFDSRYAMQRWVNTLATYSDVERYVMRRASGIVVSFGSKVTRIFDDAFNVLSLTL